MCQKGEKFHTVVQRQLRVVVRSLIMTFFYKFRPLQRLKVKEFSINLSYEQENTLKFFDS